jgi:hypothetical protein
VDTIRVEPRSKGLFERCATVGVVSGTVIGGIAGLIIGLIGHADTAWFAMFELGIPAGIACGLIGCATALVVMAGRLIRRSVTLSH